MKNNLNRDEKYFTALFEKHKAIEKALQLKQEELAAAYEQLQAQQEELTASYEELQHRVAELDATISSIAAGVIIYNKLGNIIRMNDSARNLLNYSDETYKLFYRERWPELYLSKADGTLYTVEELPINRAFGGEIIRDEEMMISLDGRQSVWISSTLAPILNNRDLIGVIFVFTDVTGRKQKINTLLASERELLKVTLNSLDEGVVATDKEERIILINDVAAKLSGYSTSEALGQRISKVFYIIDDYTGEPIMTMEHQKGAKNPVLVTRDLQEISIALTRLPIKDSHDEISGTVTVLRDITEKQQMEQELLKTDKLESLGKLAGGIAHDFNNILAAILANIQLAIMKLEKNEDINLYLKNTAETVRKASDLTKQLLTFSTGGAPVKKDASLIDLIKDTTQFVLRGANVKAEFTIPADLWAASVDVGQFSQVINNLVINAEQAMPKGGTVQVFAENAIIEEESHLKPGKYVKITVKDDGMGISKENLTKIFDPFFSTKNDGNGLGLATSYSIITRHNGYIEVTSQEHVGTAFFIYLPASNSANVSTVLLNEEIEAESGLRVLIMDDEENILFAVGEILECLGYRVGLAKDGAEAYEKYKQAKISGDPFAAVIMDLTVPGGMGGQEAITYLRDFDPTIRSIVSSGYANNPIMADYERYGFMGVVSKPYKVSELSEILQKVIHPLQL